ncbi:heme exporter protein CcmB [Legionella pneumophila]|uniref:Heme exporter protein B n=1 Tax=Legionella pneumophila subsp. pascullei TaxID=91890 RepID=A0AAX2ITI5_LEGPN|nr:heme exporter protein CcmB [Legionella pneumophila]AMP90436.1 heme exporter protein CcmB [Legionella pneumophila subsp. pascullei]AMP91896.1 transcriptional regulator [Legionella pneumophila subsp. pascullei]AMP94862.1 transcriptional regulator [Legionella pneumophila subsp. pascullei]SQG89717.1 heme exporter protein CcmB [Legionella pneumophila subsp. pascullei]VEH05266.1 heme exporter protein CcmB [Legionella pneumophila subsp. pascullei]
MNFTLQLFAKQFRRELLIQVRQIRYLVNSCLFFLMLLFIFPLTLRPELMLMRTFAPGLVWMAILLSMLLSLERLFQQDYEQGVLEQWLVSGQPLNLLVTAKVMAHWLISVTPLLLLSPLIAILFSFSVWETCILLLSLICGTPAILFLCALAAAFGIGINQRGALMALILLPLTLPLLIFGSGTLSVAMQSLPVSGYLALLLAMSLLAVGFLPYAIAAVIRISHVD